MKTRYLAGWAVVLPLLMPIRCAACSCAWTGPLLKVAPASELVIRARVLGYHGRSRGVDLAMDVEVQEVLKGNTRASRLRIWGDNGAQCRPYVSGFPVRTEWIFAIGKLTGEKGREGDYFIGGCGEYWARVENDHVVGRLSSPVPPSMADKPEQMSMKELREQLRLTRK
ncbi:MAG: hypothetical protein EXQ47_12230 [Bryobacterales bacterium]|nr:hypothetical protein [Bryobacterales bacterium]